MDTAKRPGRRLRQTSAGPCTLPRRLPSELSSGRQSRRGTTMGAVRSRTLGQRGTGGSKGHAVTKQRLPGVPTSGTEPCPAAWG